MKTIFLTGWMAALTMLSASAELWMPNVFGDHMVLQADKPVKFWGSATPGAKVKVTFEGQSAEATADDSGKWSTQLKSMKVDAKGGEVQVTDGKDTIRFEDVLVGEVWFASGQSNMQFGLRGAEGGKEAIEQSKNDPGIRFFIAKLTASETPEQDVDGWWSQINPKAAGLYSAVAYFFAQKLHRELGVPVGIIQTPWGGQPVQTFTSREALMSIPEGKERILAFDKEVAAYSEAKAKEQYAVEMKHYEDLVTKWNATPKAERKGRAPGKPQMTESPAAAAGRPATIWNGMIYPLVGYSMRGVIWYQGESDTSNEKDASEYGKLFSLMINDWRKRWGDDFRFLWVQIANFRQPVKEAGTNQPWAIVQDQQLRCLALPKTGMAVINDIGMARQVHPPNKKDVGERLARWALADDYGKQVVKCGPLYKSSQISGAEVTIAFDHIGQGLKSRDGAVLKRFEIKGEDGTWHWADAKIVGDAVVVSQAEVNKPVAVRYAWASNPVGANLVNSEGLPASIFTTE